jgi:DNA-binding NarL/FixJ family response regulator
VSASESLAVLIVDDQKAVRDGLVSLIEASGLQWRAIYTAASRDEALAIVQRHAPEVILLDIDLAGDDGLALLAQLERHERVLVLSTHDDAASRQRAMSLGAAGFARKTDPGDSLLGQLAQLAAG